MDCHHRQRLHRTRVLRRLHRAGLRGARWEGVVWCAAVCWLKPAVGWGGIQECVGCMGCVACLPRSAPSPCHPPACASTLPPPTHLRTHPYHHPRTLTPPPRRSPLWRPCPTSCPALTRRLPSWRSACSSTRAPSTSTPTSSPPRSPPVRARAAAGLWATAGRAAGGCWWMGRGQALPPQRAASRSLAHKLAAHPFPHRLLAQACRA